MQYKSTEAAIFYLPDLNCGIFALPVSADL
jgi:hypothetical protein